MNRTKLCPLTMSQHAFKQMGALYFLLGLVVFSVISPAGAARLALVVGNDHYLNLTQLRNAGADAETMAAAFRKAGYKVTLSLDRNQKAMKDDLRAFRGQIKGGDEVVLFFSGHGVQIQGENFLLPIDVRADNEDQVRDDAVALSGVLSDLRSARPGLMLAVIDACRDNPFPKTGRAIGGRGLTRTDGATGQMVLYAAGEGQQALDRLGSNDTIKNGVFTRVFVSEMERVGVPIDQVLKSVRVEVNRLASSVGHEQVPALYDQVLGTYYFYPSGGQILNARRDAGMSGARPGQLDAMNFADLEKEASARSEWSEWQAKMRRDFNTSAKFSGSADTRVKVWQRFSASYAQDNPYSRDDESLRADAGRRQEQAAAEARREQSVTELLAIEICPATTEGPLRYAISVDLKQTSGWYDGSKCATFDAKSPEIAIFPLGKVGSEWSNNPNAWTGYAESGKTGKVRMRVCAHKGRYDQVFGHEVEGLKNFSEQEPCPANSSGTVTYDVISVTRTPQIVRHVFSIRIKD